MRLIAGYIGRVKDFRPIFAKKEMPSETTSQKAKTKNNPEVSIPHNGGKSNYSVVCRRCNRKLTSEVSKNRGYGSYCWRKTKNEEAKEKARKEIEGQMNIDDVLKEGQGNEN